MDLEFDFFSSPLGGAYPHLVSVAIDAFSFVVTAASGAGLAHCILEFDATLSNAFRGLERIVREDADTLPQRQLSLVYSAG